MKKKAGKGRGVRNYTALEDRFYWAAVGELISDESRESTRIRSQARRMARLQIAKLKRRAA